ncbi:MAG: energy-coupling factor ABC transporter ATP-binding protein [Armatimonadota bacterium]
MIFELQNVDYSYPGGAPILRDISFTVSCGESIALLGANASGKSTLLHIMDGLYFPTGGRVSAFGTALTEESVETPPFSRHFRQQVGFLFQNSDAQLFCSTIEEELAFAPLQLRLSESEVEKRVEETLRLFEIEHLRARSPQTLSGGEKKKVALAGLITCGPGVILLDEPSTGLDPRSQQWLMEFLKVLNESGVTLITASHDLGFVAEVSRRTLILSEDHALVHDGRTKDALADLDLLFAANLIHAHAHRHGEKIHQHPHLHETWHDHTHTEAPVS